MYLVEFDDDEEEGSFTHWSVPFYEVGGTSIAIGKWASPLWLF